MPWLVMAKKSTSTASAISSGNAQRAEPRSQKPARKNTPQEASGRASKWCRRVAAITRARRLKMPRRWVCVVAMWSSIKAAEIDPLV